MWSFTNTSQAARADVWRRDDRGQGCNQSGHQGVYGEVPCFSPRSAPSSRLYQRRPGTTVGPPRWKGQCLTHPKPYHRPGRYWGCARLWCDSASPVPPQRITQPHRAPRQRPQTTPFLTYFRGAWCPMTLVNLLALIRLFMDMDAPAHLPSFFAARATGACLKRLGFLQG